MRGLLRSILVALLFAAVPGRSATYSISDGTFSPAAWPQYFSSSAPGTTYGFTQFLSGGNPGSYGRINMTIPSPGSTYLMTYYTGQSYSPATQGRILSIDFDADVRMFSSNPIIFFGFKQGDAYYFHVPGDFHEVNNPNWTHMTDSASDLHFGDIFTYGTPNLIDGPPMQFGVYMGTTTTGFDGYTPSFGMDNFHVTITSVPEPGVISIGLLALGTLSLAGRKHRRAA